LAQKKYYYGASPSAKLENKNNLLSSLSSTYYLFVFISFVGMMFFLGLFIGLRMALGASSEAEKEVEFEKSKIAFIVMFAFLTLALFFLVKAMRH
jgi:hypothetical protein